MSDDRTYDEPLPWLAPVEDEDEPRGLSARRMLLAILVVLLAGLIIAGTFFWIGHRDAVVSGPPQLIKAPPGPYKIKPPNAGGLDISGESETAFETSAGEDKNSKLDLNKLPETPVAKPSKAQPQAAPVPAPEAKTPTVKEAAEPKAYRRQREALCSSAPSPTRRKRSAPGRPCPTRFPRVAALNKMIVPFSGGIRLRAGAASPADAKQVCQTLKAAGENCFVAQ